MNNTDLKDKYQLQTTRIRERFDSLGVKYSGTEKSGSLISSSPSGAGGSYFYHSDHLGSSSLITDAGGNVTQHIEYVPFGEVFLEERNATWSTPYKFNGKERDEETGLSYYGARYYDPKTSVWLSVDPLAEKYPNWSSYNYCMNNPIKFIDPDGKSPYYDNKGNHLGNDEKGFKGKIYITTKDAFESNSNDGVANSKGIQNHKSTLELDKSKTKISRNAFNSILNHVVNGLITPDGKKLNNINLLYDPNLSERINYPANAHNEGIIENKYTVSVDYSDYEYTVENIRANTIHEVWGHAINKWNGDKVMGNRHYLCYMAEINSTYWEGTTERFKSHSANQFYEYYIASGKKWNDLKIKFQTIIRKYYVR